MHTLPTEVVADDPLAPSVSPTVGEQTQAPSEARRGRRLRFILPVVAFWSIPGLLVSAMSLSERGNIGLLRAFLAFGMPWYFWALATPAILWFTRIFPIDTPARWRSLTAHTAIALLTGITFSVISISARLFSGAPGPPATVLSVLREAGFWLPFELLFYGATASIGFALDYHRKLREREILASRMQARLVEAQLGALRMQLQPHFLFNALNTVAMLVRQGTSDTAVRMLARLGELLRQMLDDGGAQEVTLEEEVSLFARYLEIEQVRFGDRLDVSIDVDDEARGGFVPNLLLQPLAENAIRHGVAKQAFKSRIELRARREDGRIVVRLRNDGPSLPAGWTLSNAGIGLRNTLARLKHLYGKEGTLRVIDAPEGGVEVIVLLPYHVVPIAFAEAEHG
jgi:hypothetical protein